MNDALICIPTYNEAENIEKLVGEVVKKTGNHDLLIIDDNSPDGTGQIADSLSEEHTEVNVLHRDGKEGLGRAYLAGFDWALKRNYAFIFEMDADFSHQPKYLQPMTDALDSDDVVVGSRYVSGGGTQNWGIVRQLLSWGGSLYARTLLQLDTNDVTAGFVGWNREVLEDLELDEIDSTGYVFQIELKYRARKKGYSIHEIPIVFPDRVRGESKMTPDIAFEAIHKTIQLRFKDI